MAEASTEGQAQVPHKQAVARRRSRVWEHFTHLTTVDGNGKIKAQCNHCRRRQLVADPKDGTNHLHRHVNTCKVRRQKLDQPLPHDPPQTLPPCDPTTPTLPRTDPPSPFPCDDLPPPLHPLPQFSCAPSASQHDEELPDSEHGLVQEEEEAAAATKHLLARLIAFHGFDPLFIEDDCFRSFVGSLNPEFKLPSRLAIEELCDGIFEEARKDMLSRLSRFSGKVSLAVGTTKTIHGEVLYTACHFIDDQWKLHQMVLDAYLVSPLPFFYGPLLGVPEVTPRSDFSDLGVPEVTPKPEFYDRAAADILNSILEYDVLGTPFVIVLGINREMEREMKRMIKSVDPLASADSTHYMDKVLHSIVGIDIILDPDFTNHMYKKVNALGLTREKRQQLFSHIGLVDPLRAYDHHWYSCYCSLEFLRKHASCTIADKDCSQLIEVLCKIWGVTYRAIQRNSTRTYPTSNQCLIDLFKVREILQSELEQIDGNNSIAYNVFINEDNVADVLAEAMDTLDKTFKDSYLVWSVPLVLDPRYKLTHIKSIFSRAFGSGGARYIFEVTRKIKKLYADYIECDDGGSGTNNGADSDGVNEAAAGSSADPLGQTWDEHCLSGDIGMDDVGSNLEGLEEIESNFAAVLIQSSDDPTDAGSYLDAEKELDRYLKDPCETPIEGFDILNWWKANSCKYPTVARLARDALAMPTCSKLSSEQLAHVSSIVRGYSKKEYRQRKYES